MRTHHPRIIGGAPLARIGLAVAVALLLLGVAPALAGVVNMEFRFTPYLGNPAKADNVESVPGKARVFVNNVFFAEEDIEKDKVMVLFDDRQLMGPVWITTDNMGPRLRKGKNLLRVEFTPGNPGLAYNAELHWAAVMDEAVESRSEGRYSGTNMAGPGREVKKAKGKVVLERAFIADFAQDLPWHHAPAVTALSDDDKRAIAAVVSKRAEEFTPDFAATYRILGQKGNFDIPGIKEKKCLDQSYKVGVRPAAPPADQLEITLTGNPEVVVGRKGGEELYAFDVKLFERIKDEEVMMCAAIAISAAYPSNLVMVRTPVGGWEVAY